MRRPQISRSNLTRISVTSAWSWATLLLVAASIQVGWAQQPAGSMSPPPPPPPAPNPAANASQTLLPQADTRYSIGPGDILDIRVYNKAQLSVAGVRVDNKGMIRIPFIGEVKAACSTEAELADEIRNRLYKYQKHPEVDVRVTEFRSQQVAVIGEVRAPARFELRHRVRLLELLANANGPSDKAGQSVQVLHTAAAASSLCETAEPAPANEPLDALVAYRLSDVLRGNEESNPYIRAGDIVTIPEADQVYIVGNVYRPGPQILREPLTLSRAIVMAGGAVPGTDRSKVRVIRQAPGSTTKQEIVFDLKKIDKGQAHDVALQANDIVEVPGVTGIRKVGQDIIRAFVPSIANSVGYLPYRVIP